MVSFICTGNTCRSPMAEAIARHHLDKGLLGDKPDIFVASAGVQASDGAIPTAETLNTLRGMKIEYSGRSKRVNGPMVRKADLVFCMTGSQRAAVLELLGESAGGSEKVHLLDPTKDIEDPIGMGQKAYDALGRILTKLVPQRLKETLSNQQSLLK